MATAHADGRALAERHLAAPADPDPDGSLLNYAECSRTGDWTLRSALVRLAQPEPVRASSVLELVRRTDSALHPFAKALAEHTVECDDTLPPGVATRDRHRQHDARVVDLARLLGARPDEHDALLAGYESVTALTAGERAALPLLGAALQLDRLAEYLTTWAAAGPEGPAVGVVDSVSNGVSALLEQLGVPRESGPPPRARRSR